MALSALFYGVLVLALLGLVAGLSQSLAKVSLDSTIQSGVPVHVQASAFARSDTTLQLAWVIGGFVGIALPQVPRLGLGVGFAVLVAWTIFVLSSRPRARRPGPRPRPRPGPADRTPPSDARPTTTTSPPPARPGRDGGLGGGQSSSSSASARSTLAAGFAVRASGWRPRR